MLIISISTLFADLALSPTLQETITWVGLPWWAWFLIFLVVVFFVWWRLSASASKMEKEAESILAHADEEHPESPIAEEGVVEQLRMDVIVEAEADDLTVIEGIGPKISSLLQEAGITTYAQLADADISRLDQIVDQAGLRMVSVDTWPEQAKLARQGMWDELTQLQDIFKGGRVGE